MGLSHSFNDFYDGASAALDVVARLGLASKHPQMAEAVGEDGLARDVLCYAFNIPSWNFSRQFSIKVFEPLCSGAAVCAQAREMVAYNLWSVEEAVEQLVPQVNRLQTRLQVIAHNFGILSEISSVRPHAEDAKAFLDTIAPDGDRAAPLALSEVASILSHLVLDPVEESFQSLRGAFPDISRAFTAGCVRLCREMEGVRPDLARKLARTGNPVFDTAGPGRRQELIVAMTYCPVNESDWRRCEHDIRPISPAAWQRARQTGRARSFGFS